MPNINLHYRSDSMLPRRVNAQTQTIPYSSLSGTIPFLEAKTTEVGVIGSTYLNTRVDAGGLRCLRMISYGNWPDMSTGISVAIRLIPRFTGFATSNRGGFFIANGVTNLPWFAMYQQNSGVVSCLAVGANFGTLINVTSGDTYSFTEGTAVDIVLTWDGTNNANGVKIWINGVLFAQGTANSNTNFDAAKGNLYGTVIPCSAWSQGYTSLFDLNEFAIFDYVIDPSPSGMNLSGPARTDWIPSDPYTAEPVLPDETDVRDGVQYGLGGDEFEGNITLPSESSVLDAVSYGADGNEYTGNVTLPDESEVLDGVVFGSSDSLAGNVVLPDPSEVKEGVTFGSDDSETGTYTGTTRPPQPVGFTGLPNVAGAMRSWFQPLVFTQVEKTVVNYKNVETVTSLNFLGVWQPFTAQQLEMKPEGQRMWKWFMLHAEPTLALIPDEIVYYQDVRYRVMEKNDYQRYGYIEYHLVEDYEDDDSE